MEAKGLELKAYIDVIEDVRAILASIEKIDFAEKFDRVLARNPGFDAISEIKNRLYENAQNINPSEYVDALSPSEMAMFKFAVVSSVDVERTFSIYKTVLTDRRRFFTFEHFKQHLLFACNKDCL